VLEYTNIHTTQTPQILSAPEGAIYHVPEPFQLESGGILPEIKICYTTFGTFNPKSNNVVWVCHALTGNSNVLDWWNQLFGEGKMYDPAKYFIVCANILGSCYGSTGPLETNPATGKPYFADFPEITIKDVVGTFELLRKHLGIDRIHTCIGGSLGGQQCIEWAVSNPELIENLILMATNARSSSWCIALNETQRMAIRTDKTWGQPFAEAGEEGMKVARAIALLSYRSYQTYQETQKDDINALNKYKAVSYQVYQGEKFGKRFNAYSYWALTVMLDSHNVGRNRGSVAQALAQIKAKTLVIGIDSDVLFPILEQKYIVEHIKGAHLEVISSLYGHDGFLMETEVINSIISRFYQF